MGFKHHIAISSTHHRASLQNSKWEPSRQDRAWRHPVGFNTEANIEFFLQTITGPVFWGRESEREKVFSFYSLLVHTHGITKEQYPSLCSVMVSFIHFTWSRQISIIYWDRDSAAQSQGHAGLFPLETAHRVFFSLWQISHKHMHVKLTSRSIYTRSRLLYSKAIPTQPISKPENNMDSWKVCMLFLSLWVCSVFGEQIIYHHKNMDHNLPSQKHGSKQEKSFCLK